MIYFQTVTNMLQKSTTAVPMLFATIPKYRTIIHVYVHGYSGDGRTCKGRLGFLFTSSQKKCFLLKLIWLANKGVQNFRDGLRFSSKRESTDLFH